MELFLESFLEFFLADLLNHPKTPKWLKFFFATVLSGFLIFVFVMVALNSPTPAGKAFGGILAALFFTAAICLFIKIQKNDKEHGKGGHSHG